MVVTDAVFHEQMSSLKVSHAVPHVQRVLGAAQNSPDMSVMLGWLVSQLEMWPYVAVAALWSANHASLAVSSSALELGCHADDRGSRARKMIVTSERACSPRPH